MGSNPDSPLYNELSETINVKMEYTEGPVHKKVLSELPISDIKIESGSVIKTELPYWEYLGDQRTLEQLIADSDVDIKDILDEGISDKPEMLTITDIKEEKDNTVIMSEGMVLGTSKEAAILAFGLNTEYERSTLERQEVPSDRDKDKVDNQIFRCAKCGYETEYKFELDYHWLGHLTKTTVVRKSCRRNGKTVSCDECDYTTKNRSNLMRHKLRHKNDTEVKMYVCPDCGFQTKYQASLKFHKVRVHTDIPSSIAIKSLSCNKCDFQTNYKKSLQYHMLTHHDVEDTKYYSCDECEYRSNRKDNLKLHKLKHRDLTEVQLYSCNNCTYKSKYKAKLVCHMLVHKDFTQVKTYSCDHCAYQSKNNANLRRHMLRHKKETEVEMFSCNKCDFQTKHKSSLRSHMFRHSGEWSEVKTD